MKLRRIAAALAAGALAIVALVAATSVQNGQSTNGVQKLDIVGGINDADSVGQALSFSGRNVLVTESSPDQTFLIKRTNVAQATLYHTNSISAGRKGPQADSTLVPVSMLGANRMALLIRYSLDADSGRAALLMVQVRGHYAANADSTNTFIWRAWNTREQLFPTAAATQATIVDTIGNFADIDYNSANTDTTTGSYGERPVWLNRVDPHRAIWINLVNPETGEWFSAPYVSIRVRIMRVYGSTAVTAWTGTSAPATSIQADLVGWR